MSDIFVVLIGSERPADPAVLADAPEVDRQEDGRDSGKTMMWST
jgi:hypothetical protein